MGAAYTGDILVMLMRNRNEINPSLCIIGALCCDNVGDANISVKKNV